MDLISVIVPIYNVEPYLMRCVDSIRRQTYQNLEIILVDDGSPDRCPQICEEIKAADPRVKVIHKENGGQGMARNSGLDMATGVYVTFVDSDDWIGEDHIENLYEEAKKTGADVVIGSHTMVALDGTMHRRDLKIEKKVYEGEAVREEVVLPLIGPDVHYPQDVQIEASNSMSLYRMDVITRANIRFRSEREAIAEDMYFNVDFFCNADRVAAMDEVGYFYCENPTSTSKRYDPNRLKKTVRFYEILKEQVAQYHLEDKVALRIERTFLMKARFAIRLIVAADVEKKEKYGEIRKILRHDLVKQVLAAYPIDTYIPAMRMLKKLMKAGSVPGVYHLIKIRENAKGSSGLKRLLKKIGIGR